MMKLNRKRSKGQSLAEYALILALVAAVCVGALQALGGSITGQLNNIAGTIGG